MGKSRKVQVDEAIEEILRFRRLGMRLRTDSADERVAEVAARLGVNQDYVRKARQFADPVRGGYTDAEVKALVARLRADAKRGGEGRAVFSRTHVVRLLTVPQDQRAALQEQAIDEGWSAKTLLAEVASRFGTRGEGGRPRRQARDRSGLLTEVEQRCESWVRWHRSLAGGELSGAGQVWA